MPKVSNNISITNLLQLSNPFKQIFLVVWYIEFFKKPGIFFHKRFLSMMLLLAHDVCNHSIQMRMTI